MNIYPFIRDLYGQLRGYRRWSIRREVARAVGMSGDELAEKTLRLCRARYLYAIEHFPAYADLVKEHTGLSDLTTIPFEQLPILSKSDLTTILSKQSSFPLLPSVEKQIRHATGGSTGQPFKFFITRESFEWRTAVSDRGYSWARAEEGQRSFYVWGSAIHKPGWGQRLKAGFHHWLQNRRYFDSFHFDDARKAECCRQINKFQPVSLVGYAGNLIELARFVSRNPKVLTWRARTAVTAAEGLRPGMCELIEAHLADEVFMSYGSREFMLIGMEGPDHDGYHIAADNLYVEVVDDEGCPSPPGEIGRIVITDLHNDATPFVRYAIGDLGTWDVGREMWDVEGETAGYRQKTDGDAEGRKSEVASKDVSSPTSHVPPLTFPVSPPTSYSPFPRLAAVEGRLQEVIVRADGEKLTALFVPHLMKEFEWVDGYQVVQEVPGRITMNLVTEDAGWQGKTGGIEACLKAKLGDKMDVRFAKVDQLRKTASGKTPIMVGA